LDLSVSTVPRLVGFSWVGSSGSLSDAGATNVLEQVLVGGIESTNIDSYDPEDRVVYMAEGGQKTQVDGVEVGMLRGVGHDPAHEVAEH